ncbi:MAG: hypothetical protein EZS28_035450 [Streblomastix strix]|uniref:Uncharacterized protein n=1 Tax=Streblomastix strix TaxID=222440 RepID=A0A5J4UFK9_9EUKA|nr:MAG: hypothetical protein EZS28_035450 [Streblomastix strix]
MNLNESSQNFNFVYGFGNNIDLTSNPFAVENPVLKATHNGISIPDHDVVSRTLTTRVLSNMICCLSQSIRSISVSVIVPQKTLYMHSVFISQGFKF